MGEGGLQLPRACRIAGEDPLDAGRLLEVLREHGLEASAVAAGGAATFRLQRGEVKNPHGFDGAYRIEVASDQVLITSTGVEQ